MHEYSIVQSLVDSVAAAIGDRDAVVIRVEIAIGELAGVDRGLLATAFEVFREGTVCERALLAINPIAARWACPACGGEVARNTHLRCARCQKPARMESGDEIVLQRIEMEVA